MKEAEALVEVEAPAPKPEVEAVFRARRQEKQQSAAGDEAIFDRVEIKRAIERADLSSRQRKVLQMSFVEDRPVDEIAEAFGVARGTVYRWRNKIKKALGAAM